ncbi:unnamed protein product [Meganyctiphanes norvegica]|uniref:CUB domain-containing protein n=1 Tax=Meganyctiphanes norvegica TaxID=48144 RepID=A0AAV2R0J3_MEGNR
MALSTSLPIRCLLLLMSLVTTMVQSSAFLPRSSFQLVKRIPEKIFNKTETTSVPAEPRVVGCAVSPVKERLQLGDSVVFSSPAFPESYPNGTKCGWKLQTEKDAAIKVSCAHFDLGDGDEDVCKDYVKITNERFCGENGPEDYVVTRKVVGIYFKSSKKLSYGSFLCIATAISYPYPTAIPPTGGPLPALMNKMARW